jgi:hypothetical protein
MLKRTSGPKRQDVTGQWLKLDKQALDNACSLPIITKVNTSRTMRWAGYAACMEGIRYVHKTVDRKPEGKKPL